MTGRAGRRFQAMRLRGMIRKEFIQIVRDPSSVAVAFVLPIVLLLLFGYGVSLDARHIPIAIVVEQPDPATTSVSAAFRHSEYFSPVIYRNIQSAQSALKQHRVDAILWLRADFARRLFAGGEAPMALGVNGVDANQARITEGYLQGVWLAWLTAYAREQGRDLPVPVSLEPRVWYNPALISRHFLVLGLVVLLNSAALLVLLCILAVLVMRRTRKRLE